VALNLNDDEVVAVLRAANELMCETARLQLLPIHSRRAVHLVGQADPHLQKLLSLCDAGAPKLVENHRGEPFAPFCSWFPSIEPSAVRLRKVGADQIVGRQISGTKQ
jgi:hypothetical protein